MKPVPMFHAGTGEYLGEATPELLDSVPFMTFETVPTALGPVRRTPGIGDGKANPASFPPLRPLSEVYAEGLEPLEWVIEEMLPMKAITLVIGNPKVGKTTMFLSWIKAMHVGAELWCGFKVMPSVCWLFTDEGPHSLAKAIDKMEIPVEGQQMEHRVASISDAVCDWAELCEWIGDRVVEVKNAARHAADEAYTPDEIPPRVILIDTYGAWAGLGDVRDYAKMMDKMNPVKRLRDRTSCAIVLIHHSRKPSQGSQDEGTNASLGSQAIAGQADHVIHFTEHKEIPVARMAHFSTRMSDTSGERIGLYYEDGDYRRITKADIDGVAAAAAQVGEMELLVVGNCFGAEFTRMKEAIAQKPGKMKDHKFRALVKDLLAEGRLENNGQASNSPQLAYRWSELEVDPQAYIEKRFNVVTPHPALD